MEYFGSTPERLIAHLRAEGEALAAAAAKGLSTTVPTTPEWTIRDLVEHSGVVFYWVAGLLDAAPGEKIRFGHGPDAPADETVLTWFEDSVGLVADALARADYEAPVRTFVGEQPRAFWLRRVPLEASIHRFDAESAFGTPNSIDPTLSVSGIDEIFEVYVPSRFDTAAFGGSGETLHLHATDIDGEWMIHFGADQVTWEHGHGKGDAAVRGTASDLYMLMWNRLSLDDRFELFGDGSLLERWRSTASF